MKKYYVDSNFFLRFILKDNLNQWKVANDYFKEAKLEKVKLVFLTETIIEIEYVLRKVYKLSRKIISKYLLTLLSISYFEITDRELLKNALLYYVKKNIDFVDIIIFLKAKEENAEVLTFDKDFDNLH
jgi:predicted nucleic-acid-binding protein